MKGPSEMMRASHHLPGAGMLPAEGEILSRQRHNPFMKNGEADIEAYIAFVQEFNAFINHQPKPFRPMIDRIMKL